jgi:hypothetical protein
MALQYDALERCASARTLVSAPNIPLSSAGKSILDLFGVVFVVGLKKYLIVLRYIMQDANLSVNLMSSCMVQMMIAS